MNALQRSEVKVKNKTKLRYVEEELEANRKRLKVLEEWRKIFARRIFEDAKQKKQKKN